jgi:Domain of unknown function (DUF4936)
MLNYYIYYRVAPSDAARARTVVDAVQSKLRQDIGIQGRLMRRDDDPSTWMEIYEAVTDRPRFEATLERLLAQYGFDGCVASNSRRTIERFTLF